MKNAGVKNGPGDPVACFVEEFDLLDRSVFNRLNNVSDANACPVGGSFVFKGKDKDLSVAAKKINTVRAIVALLLAVPAWHGAVNAVHSNRNQPCGCRE